MSQVTCSGGGIGYMYQALYSGGGGGGGAGTTDGQLVAAAGHLRPPEMQPRATKDRRSSSSFRNGVPIGLAAGPVLPFVEP